MGNAHLELNSNPRPNTFILNQEKSGNGLTGNFGLAGKETRRNSGPDPILWFWIMENWHIRS